MTDSDFTEHAAYIATEFQKSYYVVHDFDVAPEFIIELDKSSLTLESLAAGDLPDNGLFSGGAGWQLLFGKSINTGDWSWEKLRKSWTYAKIYKYLLAKIIQRAIGGSSTSRAFLLKSPVIPSLPPSLYRVALRRYEELSNERYRFYFTAALIDLPFNIPSDRAEKSEVTLYHLINLTWYFRRQFVDRLYNRLLDIISQPPEDRVEAKDLCDEIAYELMDIDAQALSRGVDNPRTVQDALGNDPHVAKIMAHGRHWYTLRPKILRMLEKSVALEDIAKAVYEITKINYEFYIVVADAFNRTAKVLKPPSSL